MANFNFNKAIIGGRLTANPELKTTASGVAVVSFSVAVSRRYTSEGAERQTDFINCVAWRQNAEFVSKFFKKGSSICVVGQIQTRSWDDQSGSKRYATEVVVDEVLFVDSKGETSNVAPGVPAAQPQYATSASQSPEYEEIGSEDDLPF